MWRKYSKHSGVYHSQNNIENFKFVLSLRNVDSLIKVPKFDGGSDAQSFCDSDDLIEEIEIKWQEKVFSAVELEVYSNANNCMNDTQKRYHKVIQSRTSRAAGTIFTYVDADNFKLKDSLGFHTESRAAIPSILEGDEAKNEERMYVFASLNPDTFLFCISWRPVEQILIVFPDFNSNDEDPYYIEIEADYRHLYSYVVKNTSKTLEVPSVPKRTKSKKKDPSLPDVAKVFDIPPDLSTRFSILFEIQSAANFEYENLHVRYKITVPDRFILEEGALVGSTHSAISKHSIWRFGHCCQLTILSATNVPLDENLVIHFEIISIDSWTRERSEGFGQIFLKLRPQKFSGIVPCYRLDYGLLDEVERFFIGGRKQFDLEKFCIGGDGLLNRYGNKTISTGSLSLQCQMMRQKHINVRR